MLRKAFYLETMSRSIDKFLVVLETVTGDGCRKPLIRWPTKAKWKLF
jgi:hypothetical protein